MTFLTLFTMINTLKQALEVARDWYAGDTSYLYSFVSTRGSIRYNISNYIQEIDECLSVNITDTQRNELEGLKEYFEGCRTELQDS